MDRRAFILMSAGASASASGTGYSLGTADRQSSSPAGPSAQPKPAVYVPYTDDVEQIQPGEAEVNEQIRAALTDIARKVGQRDRHTVRGVHAKSHGLLRAEFTVLPHLPAALRQGLFAQPSSYGAILRFSTVPGEILSDHISTTRGLAIKVVGIDGEMLPEHAGQLTQDFVLNNGAAFHSPDGRSFLKGIQVIDRHVDDPEVVKQAVSSVALTGEEVLESVHAHSSFLKSFGQRPVHPLGQTYYTAAPIRYGDYFGQIHLVPVSANLVALEDKDVSHPARQDCLRDSILDFFRHEDARWEVRVQLCTDLAGMPVEDASVPWDRALSPPLTIGTLTASAQDAYSDARRVWVDEELSFSPWHSLAAHRPLGNIMRARRVAYPASSAFRHASEGRKKTEPRSIDELPL